MESANITTLNLDDIPMPVIKCDMEENIIYFNQYLLNDPNLKELHLFLDAKASCILDLGKDTIEIQSILYKIHKREYNDSILFFIETSPESHTELTSTTNFADIDVSLANITHEIRSPLNAIIGITSLMQDTELDKEQRVFIDMLNESNYILMNIVDNILDWYNLKAGKLKLKIETFCLKDSVDEIHALVASNAAVKSINMTYVIEESTVNFIIGDKLRFQQILINIYTNSLKYIATKAFIKTKISARKKENKSDMWQLQIHVHDYYNHPKDIFDDEKPPREDDLGLSLVISKKLCELMNGNIYVTATGVTIDIEVQTVSTQGHASSISESKMESLKNKRVLLVDDILANRIILGETISKKGMLPFLIASSEEAIMCIKNGMEFDIGLIDIYLPKYNGVNLARNIKLTNPDMPLIALSSIGDNIGDTLGLFKSILTKPVENTKLFDTILNALNEPVKNVKKKGVSFLIDEDDFFNREILKYQLKKLGYTDISEVENGEQCIEILKIKQFDVIFIDIKTPKADGYAVIDFIKKNPRKNKPFCIYLSGTKIKDEYHDLFNGILNKPIIMEKLVELMERFKEYKGVI